MNDHELSDERRAPFCFQTHDALDAIREHGGKATTLAIYLALTETANRRGGAPARDSFTALRAEVADRAGVSVDTLDRHVPTLEAAGVLTVEKRMDGNLHLPTRWTLTEPQAAPRGRNVRPPSPQDAAIARDQLSEPKKTPVEETPPIPPDTERVAATWTENAPPLIEHRPSYFATAKLWRKVKSAVAQYGIDDVCSAIHLYAHVVASPDHFFNYRWTLLDFLGRGLDRFVPEARPLDNFHSGPIGSARRGMSPAEIAQLTGDDL